MSRKKLRGLWLVVAVEAIAILALLVWGLAFKHPAPTLAPGPKTVTHNTAGYKTPKIELAQVVGGLKNPTVITAMPDALDKRLFVVEQDGTIRIVTADKSLSAIPFLDIKSKVQSAGEMGLLGLVFHPKVAQNGYFFIDYVDKNQNTIIARYTISQSNGMADPNSEKVLLKIKQPYANHNGGQLAFGPDGYLYIGMGDGGSAGDPENRAQNKNELLGKILRINVDQGTPYAIPSDNPFAKGGGKPEIWALGLRNPWRFSFDPKTSDLYIADVGQGDYEEIDLHTSDAAAGVNYGWRCFEGIHSFNAAGCADPSTYTSPILEYSHTDGRCSITGGYVYRGVQFPALMGKYFYGDYCSGEIFYAEKPASTWNAVMALNSDYKLSTFGEDSSGELYVADHDNGVIYQLVDTANPTVIVD
jgi:glucose/arabinose dehydrogenase